MLSQSLIAPSTFSNSTTIPYMTFEVKAWCVDNLQIWTQRSKRKVYFHGHKFQSVQVNISLHLNT